MSEDDIAQRKHFAEQLAMIRLTIQEIQADIEHSKRELDRFEKAGNLPNAVMITRQQLYDQKQALLQQEQFERDIIQSDYLCQMQSTQDGMSITQREMQTTQRRMRYEAILLIIITVWLLIYTGLLLFKG